MGMVGELVPLVLIPRFTSYFGTTEYATVPLDLSAFAGGGVTLWRGKMIGSGTGFAMYTENSHDCVKWFGYPLAAGVPVPWQPGADSSMDVGLDLSRRWFRVRIVLTGTGPAVTCWCAGMLEYRIDA